MMTKKLISWFVLLAFALGAAGLAEPDILTADEGWSYVGFTEGGVACAIPKTFEMYSLTPDDERQGFLLLGGDEDFMLQVRRFEPEEMTYEQFFAMVSASNAEISVREYPEGDILSYRNPAPTAVSELWGVALTGMDGRLYKFSVFTGDSEDFSPEAPVWQIAGSLTGSVFRQDFSEWPDVMEEAQE